MTKTRPKEKCFVAQIEDFYAELWYNESKRKKKICKHNKEWLSKSKKQKFSWKGYHPWNEKEE